MQRYGNILEGGKNSNMDATSFLVIFFRGKILYFVCINFYSFYLVKFLFSFIELLEIVVKQFIIKLRFSYKKVKKLKIYRNFNDLSLEIKF